MASLPNQKLLSLYEKHTDKELAFNKSLIDMVGLETKKVFLKVKGDQWPCVVYSCSMRAAKIVITMDSKSFEMLKLAKNFVSLRMCFSPKELKSSIVFFVPALVTGYNSYIGGSANLFIVSLRFTQKPPDDLIEIIGKIFESAENFEKRKDIRISLDQKIADDMGLKSNRTIAVIDNIKRPAIIRDISASGTQIILACVPKFIMNKTINIYLYHRSKSTEIMLTGNTVRYEEIPGRKDIYAIGILFDQTKIPLDYKEIINNYIDSLEEMAKQKK